MTKSDKLSSADIAVDGNYSRKVALALRGYGKAEKLKEHKKRIAIMIIDKISDVTGRLSVTFYQELQEDEYLEKIAKWHEDSVWELTAFRREELADSTGKKKEGSRAIHFIGAPSFRDILVATYGRQRSGSDKSYDVLKKKTYKQLLECVFGNFAFPRSYINSSSARASRPMGFVDTNGSFDEFQWLYSLETTCALIKKYYIEHYKEDFTIAL